MKPFVLIDVDEMELIIVIKNAVKRIKINKIDESEDFIDEFYRRFKEINFVPKYQSINRKDFMDMLSGLKKVETSRIVEEKKEQQIIERPSSELFDKKSEIPNKDMENSTLIRSNTERKIAIEDLDMRFDEPYDYYDLALYNEDKIRKSTHLNHFLKNGILVRTTMDELAKLRSSVISEKEREKKERQESLIIERKKNDDENLIISSEQYRNAEEDTYDEQQKINVPKSDATDAVREMFSNANSAIDPGDSSNIDRLLSKT